jgi:hypothetical protein
MTTTTREELQWLAGGRLTEAQMQAIAAYFKYTIAEPQPPEAMVRLADQIAYDAGDNLMPRDYTLAALKHFEKLVRDAPVQRWERLPSGLDGTDGLIYRNAILTAIGAKP